MLALISVSTYFVCMGRVFTAGELATNQVPQPEDFREAAAYLLDRLHVDTADANGTAGALVFGSTTKDGTTPRSDLDILIAHNAEDRELSEVSQWYRSLFDTVRDTWSVPVESSIHRSRDLQNGHHNVDPIFMMHLQTVGSEWIVGVNPVSLITERGRTFEEVFVQYVFAKQAKFSKAQVHAPYEEVDCKALQRAFELPSALGRKALAVMIKNEVIDADDYQNAPKSTVTAAISRICPEPVTKPMYELLALDNDYNEMLDDIFASRFNPDDYVHYLRQFSFLAIPAALDLTDRLGNYVLAKIR